MSSFVVGKKDGFGIVVPADRQAGMAKAGEEIARWMNATPEKDKDDFFHDIYDDITGPPDNYEVFYFDEGGQGQAVSPDTRNPRKRQKYKYTDSNDTQRFLRVKIEEDDESETRMTIVVPRKRTGLLVGGYVNTIVTDLDAIDADLAADPDKKAKYLLASVFLTRCH